MLLQCHIFHDVIMSPKIRTAQEKSLFELISNFYTGILRTVLPNVILKHPGGRTRTPQFVKTKLHLSWRSQHLRAG